MEAEAFADVAMKAADVLMDGIKDGGGDPNDLLHALVFTTVILVSHVAPESEDEHALTMLHELTVEKLAHWRRNHMLYADQ